MNLESSHIEWTDGMLFDRLIAVVELLEIPRDPEHERTKQLVNEKAYIDFEIAQRTGAVLLPQVVTVG